MKAQLQAAIANTSPPPPPPPLAQRIATAAPTTGGAGGTVPPVATAPVATLAQRIAAATTLAALLPLEAEARTSAEVGVWLIYLDAVAVLHATATAAQVNAAATKAAADAAAAQAVADALLQSTILKIVEKFAPAIAAMPALLAQIQPALDAYRASRAGNASVSVASIINAVANAPMPLSAASGAADIPVDQMTDAQKRECGIMVW